MQSFRSRGASLVLCAAFVLACSSSADKRRQTVPSSDRDILALKPEGTNALIVHAIGYGTGTITISDPSQTCVTYEWGETSNHYSQVCWAYVPIATSSVTVTATANNGSQFTGWGSLCASATERACTIPMDQDRIFSVGFVPKPPEPKTEYVLSVRVLGFVDGDISASPNVGLVCSPGRDDEDVISVNYARTCTALVPTSIPPTQVTLTATPTAPGTRFAGWGGSCGGTGTCTVTVDRDVGITAGFVRTGTLTAVVDIDSTDPTAATIVGILNVSHSITTLSDPGDAIGVAPGRNLLLGLDPSGRVVHVAVVFGLSWSSTDLGVRTTVQGLFLSALAGVVEDARAAELASAWLVDQPEFPQAIAAVEALLASRGYLDASAPEASTLLGLLTSITERLAQSVIGDGALASSSAALGVASSTGSRQVRSSPLVASSAALTSTLGYLLPKGIRIDWSPRAGSCTSGDMTFQNPNPHFTRIELSTELGPLAVPSNGYTLIAPYEVVPDASVSGLVSFVHSWVEAAFADNLGFEPTTVAIEVPRSARTLNVAAVDADVRSILANVIVDAARATSLPISGEMLGTLVEGALLLVDVERASRQFEVDQDVAQFVRAVARPTTMYVVSQAEQWLISRIDRFLAGQPLAIVGAEVGLLKSAFYIAILSSDLSTDSSAALSTSALFGVACAAGSAPALSVTPATGLRGTSYAVSGTGFTPNSRVEVYLQTPDGTVSNVAVNSDALGAFVWAYDSTAADRYGQFTCRAVDSVSGITSNTASFTVTAVVAPAVSVSPTTGGRGTTFSETGSGFTPGGNVTLHFRQPDGTETPTVTRIADSNGAYTHSWTSSATSLLGTYLYWAVDTASGTASNTVSFTLTSSASGSFSATGSLSGVRAYHTATVLTDGKVLIAGGYDGTFDVALAEIYDPATGSFSQTGAMVTPRGDHAAVRLHDGRVLLVGGRGAYRDLASAEIFDPATGRFTATGSMSTNRRYPTATLLPNGTVLVTGGVVDTYTWTGLATAEVYDPTSGQFSATGSLRTTRYGHTATLLATGAVLVAGGTVGVADLTSAEVYDPIAGTFAPTGDMSAPRAGHTATLLRSGKVLLAGGYANAQGAAFTAEIYDPALGGFSPAGSLHGQRGHHTATLRGDGTVLIAGGFVTATAEVYDPIAGTFVPTASMNLPRYNHTAVLLGNGAVLVAGGLGDSPIYTATAELYR